MRCTMHIAGSFPPSVHTFYGGSQANDVAQRIAHGTTKAEKKDIKRESLNVEVSGISWFKILLTSRAECKAALAGIARLVCVF